MWDTRRGTYLTCRNYADLRVSWAVRQSAAILSLLKKERREEARWFAILAIKTGRSRLSLEGRVNAVFTCSPYHKFPADSRFAQGRMIALLSGETKAGMRLITPSKI